MEKEIREEPLPRSERAVSNDLAKIHLSGHEEDLLLGSLEILVVLVGKQLVDVLLPIVIVHRVSRGEDVALLVATRYNLVIL